MFRKPIFETSNLIGVELYEDDCLTDKMKKIKTEGGQVETGAETIYTNKTDGVMPAHDIRTDRMEIAQNTIQKAQNAKRDAKMKQEAEKVAKAQEKGESATERLKSGENGQSQTSESPKVD